MVCDVFSALKFQLYYMNQERYQKPFFHIPVNNIYITF